MQGIEMVDYVNVQPKKDEKCNGDANQGRRLCQLLFLSVGLLCIVQATLNISLRVISFSSRDLTPPVCNNTEHNQMKEVQNDCEQKRPTHCNKLQERFNALTRDRNMLENRNTELNNMLKAVREERDRLKMKMRELTGCVSSQRCPPQWREINSRCYFLSSENKTWEDSRKYCQSKGADLVVINNEQEQRAIYRMNGNSFIKFWIGLRGRDGNFRWVDGSGLTNTFWQTGQPDRGGSHSAEDCVLMHNSGPTLSNWNDAVCGLKLSWLCEKDPCPST